MEIREVQLTDEVLRELIAMSETWETENISYGYVKNEYDDIAGNRIFLAEENGEVIGYLFGHRVKASKSNSVVREGTEYFELEELYVKPAHRSQGAGSALFRYMEARLEPELKYILLGSASKNYKAILHFYIEEMGMEFWSARLFKRLENVETRG